MANPVDYAIDHARLLLNQFGGLKGIEEASFGELDKVGDCLGSFLLKETTDDGSF